MSKLSQRVRYIATNPTARALVVALSAMAMLGFLLLGVTFTGLLPTGILNLVFGATGVVVLLLVPTLALAGLSVLSMPPRNPQARLSESSLSMVARPQPAATPQRAASGPDHVVRSNPAMLARSNGQSASKTSASIFANRGTRTKQTPEPFEALGEDSGLLLAPVQKSAVPHQTGPVNVEDPRTWPQQADKWRIYAQVEMDEPLEAEDITQVMINGSSTVAKGAALATGRLDSLAQRGGRVAAAEDPFGEMPTNLMLSREALGEQSGGDSLDVDAEVERIRRLLTDRLPTPVPRLSKPMQGENMGELRTLATESVDIVSRNEMSRKKTLSGGFSSSGHQSDDEEGAKRDDVVVFMGVGDRLADPDAET